MISHPGLPRLTPENHRVSSPETTDYNCIAWAAGDTGHWWEPGRFWPVPVRADAYGIDVLVSLFGALSFIDSGDDPQLEPGVEKVALYSAGQFYTHAARQLPNGKWTSKLGKWVDIEHNTPEDIAGGLYGNVYRIMKRPTPPST